MTCQKERIADLYHRVAATYGQIGPNIFAYAGQQLVERMTMTEGSHVLDVLANKTNGRPQESMLFK